jgi:hypothetical protein
MSGLKVRAIERGREAPRGHIVKDVDLEWEAYLQAHNHAERLGLLAHDQELHDFLDAKLGDFEKAHA